MGKRNICYKKKSRRSIMKRIRPDTQKRQRTYSSSSNTDEKSVNSIQNQSTSSIKHIKDNLDFYFIIHMNSLMLLLKQVLCSGCNRYWDGSVFIRERNGLYMQLEFKCSNCGSLIHLYSSPKMQNSRRHEINIRLAIGGTLCGLGHSGMIKLLGALNLPPPVQEYKYREAQEFILNFVEKAQEQSMVAAVKEAVDEASGVRDLTISGDGTWLTRGLSSIYRISA
jgi:hypothetical protein